MELLIEKIGNNKPSKGLRNPKFYYVIWKSKRDYKNSLRRRILVPIFSNKLIDSKDNAKKKKSANVSEQYFLEK